MKCDKFRWLIAFASFWHEYFTRQVATHLRWGGICVYGDCFSANFVENDNESYFNNQSVFYEVNYPFVENLCLEIPVLTLLHYIPSTESWRVVSSLYSWWYAMSTNSMILQHSLGTLIIHICLSYDSFLNACVKIWWAIGFGTSYWLHLGLTV